MLFASSAFAQKHTAGMSSGIAEDHEAAAAAWLAHFINPMDEPNYETLKQIGFEQFHHMDNRPAMKTLSSAAWVEVAKSQEGNVSGRPSGIDFDPNGTTFYLATTNGGIWKTTNNGQNWTPLSDSWKTLNVGGVAVDPENPSIVYAGTGIHLSDIGGDGDFSGVGVYKSIDGGLNWTLLDSSSNSVTTQMEVNPADGSLIYRATTSGIRRSSDAGLTWTLTAPLGGATTMVIDPNNPAIIYAAGGNQIKKSVDSGQTWQAVGTGYPTGALMVLAMSRSSSDTLYISTGNGVYGNINASSSTLAISSDQGQTWHTQSANVKYTGTQAYYDNAIAVNPQNPSDVIVGGLDIYTSTRAGANLSNSNKVTDWTAASGGANYTHADIHILKYNPYTNVLFALTDGGIFYSSTNGGSWRSDMNTDLGTFLFVGGDMAVDQSTGKPSFFAAGAQDNGLNGFTVGESSYDAIKGGDGGTMFVSPQDGETTFGTYVGATLYRSPDRGANGDLENAGNLLDGTPIQNDGAPFYIEYDVADQDPSVIAVCGGRNLFLTTDGGNGGAGDFPQVTNVGAGTTTSGYPSAVHIAKDDDTYIYLGTSSGTSPRTSSSGFLYYSQDQGASWTKCTNPNNFGGLPTSITSDPNDATHVFMTVGGTNSKHFWVSTDGGVDWTAPATNLPNLNYRRVAFDGKIIYVGNDYGVLRSGDGGKTWFPVADGLPMAMVTSLHVRGHYLSATTYGRGMYYVDLNQVAPLSDVSVAANTNSGVQIGAIYPSVITSAAPHSTINYTLANNDEVSIALYDVLGRQERMLVNQFASKGDHEVSADFSGLAPGQHYVVLTSDGVSVTKPVTIE